MTLLCYLVFTVQLYGGEHNISWSLDKPRSVSPKRFTPRKERYIRSWMLLTSNKNCRESTESNLSPLIRGNLKLVVWNQRRSHKGMELTVRHKRQLRAWANQHMHRNWRTVLCSDETGFTLKFVDGRIRVWRRPVERFAEVCVMSVDRFGSGSFMVWRGAHDAGKNNLIMIRQTLNTQHPVVVPFIPKNNCVIFHQDHAQPHTARLSVNFLQANNVNTLPCPSRSADLTPIEHACDMLNRRMRTLFHSTR